MAIDVNQRGARAGGNVVGGNLNNYFGRPPTGGKIEALKACLQHEMDQSQTVRDLVDTLQRYHNQKAPADGIIGLEQKLTHSGRDAELIDALEQKELFAKLLAKWSLYASAQEIIAHLLAKAVVEFRQVILPQLGGLSPQAINELVTSRIVYPLVDEVGHGVFTVDAEMMMGLFYWLAEQCYVRWHA